MSLGKFSMKFCLGNQWEVHNEFQCSWELQNLDLDRCLVLRITFFEMVFHGVKVAPIQ